MLRMSRHMTTAGYIDAYPKLATELSSTKREPTRHLCPGPPVAAGLAQVQGGRSCWTLRWVDEMMRGFQTLTRPTHGLPCLRLANVDGHGEKGRREIEERCPSMTTPQSLNPQHGRIIYSLHNRNDHHNDCPHINKLYTREPSHRPNEFIQESPTSP